MKAFVTGATGFVGSRLVVRLQQGGVEVVALARSEAAETAAKELHCEPRRGDLSDVESLCYAVRDCDAVFHLAGYVHTGVSPKKRDEVFATNITGTENMLEAAKRADIKRVVYVSTINTFGDTKGRAVDETYRRPEADPYRSLYDESKTRAHHVARRFADDGLPLVIAMPGMIYGPGDNSTMGKQIRGAATGRLPAVFFGGLGVDMVHVDDVADGIVRAHDKGHVHQQYLLTGDKMRLREILRVTAEQAGKRPPRPDVPDIVPKLIARMGPLAQLAGFPENPAEVVRATAGGITYWGENAKARRELDWTARSFADGVSSAS